MVRYPIFKPTHPKVLPIFVEVLSPLPHRTFQYGIEYPKLQIIGVIAASREFDVECPKG